MERTDACTEEDRLMILELLQQRSVASFKMLSYTQRTTFEQSRYVLSEFLDSLPDSGLAEYTVAYVDITDAAITLVLCDVMQWRTLRKPVYAIVKGRSKTAHDIDNADVLFMTEVFGNESARINEYRNYCSRRLEGLVVDTFVRSVAHPPPSAHAEPVVKRPRKEEIQEVEVVEHETKTEAKVEPMPESKQEQKVAQSKPEAKTAAAPVTKKPTSKPKAGPSQGNINAFFKKKE